MLADVLACVTGVKSAILEFGAGVVASGGRSGRPSLWIGWFGFAQGVCSRNCCSDAAAAVAMFAETTREAGAW